VFVSIFAPLGIVITATASVVFFGDALNLGMGGSSDLLDYVYD
jgi:multidrug transporter EmrE-like cation transporter